MVEDTPVNTGVAAWPDPVSAAVAVRRMQTKLHRWAGDDPARRFGDLFNLVYDPAFLMSAWQRVSGNTGSRTPGVDRATVASILTAVGVENFLGGLREQLKSRTFRPVAVRQVMIPKASGKLRKLGIPTVADRVVQAALKSVLEQTLTGTPQGGILSPLLANIALSALDDHFDDQWRTEMADWHQRDRRRRSGQGCWKLIRYADDFVLVVNGQRQHAEALRGQVAELLTPLGLQLAPEKTCVVGIDEGFDFLGFHIRRMRKRGTNKHYVYTVPSRKAIAMMRAKVSAATYILFLLFTSFTLFTCSA